MGDRDQKTGRFLVGNTCATGNPYAKRVNELRTALMDAVGAGDVRDVIRAMVDAAKGGDVQAARLLLDRTVGATPVDLNVSVAEPTRQVDLSKLSDDELRLLIEINSKIDRAQDAQDGENL